MQNINGTIVTKGHKTYLVPSKSSRFNELHAKQQAQLEKLAENKKYRQEHPSTWEVDRDLKLILQKH